MAEITLKDFVAREKLRLKEFEDNWTAAQASTDPEKGIENYPAKLEEAEWEEQFLTFDGHTMYLGDVDG